MRKTLKRGIWRDRSIIPLLPGEDKTLIRSYPMGLENRKHSQMVGWIIFTHKTSRTRTFRLNKRKTPFGCPISTAWRVEVDNEKSIEEMTMIERGLGNLTTSEYQLCYNITMAQRGTFRGHDGERAARNILLANSTWRYQPLLQTVFILSINRLPTTEKGHKVVHLRSGIQQDLLSLASI